MDFSENPRPNSLSKCVPSEDTICSPYSAFFSGQSADIEMVKVLLTRSRIEFTMEPGAQPKALAASGVRTLVIAVGGSSKSLGAAGISAESEIERTKPMIAEAKRLGLKIIGIHFGGEARRGELSDKFILKFRPKFNLQTGS